MTDSLMKASCKCIAIEKTANSPREILRKENEKHKIGLVLFLERSITQPHLEAGHFIMIPGHNIMIFFFLRLPNGCTAELRF